MPVPERDFVWGVAASSAQTESRHGRGPSNWDIFSEKSGAILDGSTTAELTQFDSRYLLDLDLLAQAGVPAFRLSTSWPRIQPDGPGKPSEEGLDHYDRLFDAMLKRGIEPWVTLFHWDVPVWAGDFLDRTIASRLADYCEIMVARFGDRVKNWIMLNEPNTVAAAGYATGRHAPGLASTEAMIAAVHHQNLALGLMLRAARSQAPIGANIGTTHNVAAARAAGPSEADEAAARKFETIWNWVFLDPLFGQGYPAGFLESVSPLIEADDLGIIAAEPDFLGINYYCRVPIVATSTGAGFELSTNFAPELERTEYFAVEPDGLTEALMTVHNRYGRIPTYITEAGFAFGGEKIEDRVNDPDRSRHIGSYLAAAAEASAQGADLRGFFYWSATDNWEWANGFTRHFGLIAVDPVTQRRLPKQSLGAFGAQVKRYFPITEGRAAVKSTA
jgi:beta-glucosidase